MTLTIQGTCEQLAGDLALTFSERSRADERIGGLQSLIDDRAALLASHDGSGPVPRAVLERHGWLAVREARLNVRDAPGWWTSAQASAIAHAAERGAQWLENQGIVDGDSMVAV